MDLRGLEQEMRERAEAFEARKARAAAQLAEIDAATKAEPVTEHRDYCMCDPCLVARRKAAVSKPLPLLLTSGTEDPPEKPLIPVRTWRGKVVYTAAGPCSRETKDTKVLDEYKLTTGKHIIVLEVNGKVERRVMMPDGHLGAVEE